MAKDERDILDVLKLELDFLEQGGYGRSASTPWKWTSTFQHSPSCINFNRPERTRPCTECPLIDFVPAAARSQDVPCHHIPVGPTGETVNTLEREHDLLEVEEALKKWLQSTIRQIQLTRAAETPRERSA